MSTTILIILANTILVMGFAFGGWTMTVCAFVAAATSTVAAVIAFRKKGKK